ncbi:hypothetical protein CLAFUW4_10882 [Fulvia fulva]|nr:hypothetical protein CLAFUR4_10887 [Fulvia fulva]KAK4621030.1 hypothetical protein CLAFUR0_10894 [Fulvia fulva]WPV16858.1 hypothetical protein CLAFUW4_10882 [Fulvia fulva]WPV32029.1 hypothetical protein CLAFUW7_10880 [Fulvia fulva]
MADTTATANSADVDILPDFISLFEPAQEDSVCDFGDIILVADDGFHPVLKLRVSSCILANTSTFFKALFSKKYAEGQRQAGPGPREITIKDKPSALTSLCCLLHHKDPAKSAQEKKLKWDDSDLYDLAVIADKFDCVEAIRLQTETFFSAVHGAYFRECTKYLVQHFNLIAKKDIDEQLQAYLPKDLRTSVNAQISVARERLTFEIAELNNQFINACKVVGEGAATVNSFMETLRDYHVWPLDFRWQGVENVLGHLEDLGIPILSADKVVNRIRSESAGSCKSFDSDGWGRTRNLCEPEVINAPTDRSVRERVERVRQLCVGICLDCIRDRPCRESHHYKWEKDAWESLGIESEAGSEDGVEVMYDAYKLVEKPIYWEDAW